MEKIISILADQYYSDLTQDGRTDTRDNLRAWLWFTCPAEYRTDVEDEIYRRRQTPTRTPRVHL